MILSALLICPFLGTIRGLKGNGQLANFYKRLVGRDGIDPPTPGFSILEHETRKCAEILALQELLRSSCAGVLWNDQECAPGRHILGTFRIHSSRSPRPTTVVMFTELVSTQ